MKKFSLIFSIALFLTSCIKVKPSPFDTSQNPAALVAEIVLTADSGTATGTGTSTGTGTGIVTGTGSQVTTPTFSPSAGHYSTAQNISISTTTSGASIYYTTDGSTPTSSSSLYSTSIHIWSLAGKTVKAIATKTGMTDSSVATLSGTFSYPPLKTGQTVQYRWGDDGTYQSGVTRGYTDNGDGTVTDDATGMVWQKCSMGQTNDATCSGAATTDNWTNAGTYCSGLSLASKTWRLPTRQELETLPDYSTSAPAIKISAFPGTVYPGQYWSSTTYAPDSNYAWELLFIAGSDGRLDHSTLKTSATNYVRCVSGSPKEYSSNFTDNGDGTVKDNATGLVWQKCSRGQVNDATCSGAPTSAGQDFNNNVDYCNGLALAGRTWRLPSVNELKTIVDTTKASGVAIDTTVFPGTGANNYRASTTYAALTTSAWLINFNDGLVAHVGKAAGYYARCVSGP